MDIQPMLSVQLAHPFARRAYHAACARCAGVRSQRTSGSWTGCVTRRASWAVSWEPCKLRMQQRRRCVCVCVPCCGHARGGCGSGTGVCGALMLGKQGEDVAAAQVWSTSFSKPMC